ncbi:MAG: hypothetical protein PHS60_02570 [Zavarzinia sp.]|nr:hypothetical protein [Zavarzinia sp.]
MTTINDVRAAIAARLQSVGDIGVVHAYERFAAKEKAFADFYVVPGGAVRGWNIRCQSFRRSAVSGGVLATTWWRITGYLSMVDADASDLDAIATAGAISQAFEADPTLGGLCRGQPVDGQVGAELQGAEPVMFAGVLCHRVILRLATEQYIAATGGLDDHAGPAATLLDAVVARLAATLTPPFDIVEGRPRFNAKVDPIPAGLSIIVSPGIEEALPAATTMRVRQRVSVSFRVTVAAPDRYGDESAALNALNTLRAMPRDQLLGWGQEAGVTDSPIIYRGGISLASPAGVLAWQDTYETALYYKQV